MKRTILITAAFVAVSLLLPAASAGQMWQDCSGAWSGNWSDPCHWRNVSEDGVIFPTSGGSGAYTVTMDVATAAHQKLTMHSDAKIDMQAGNRLEIGSANGQFSKIDGKIKLLGSSVLRFMNSHTIVGGGSIDGQSDSAAIEIADSVTLTNAMLIEGNCQIRPVPGGDEDPTFINNGTVHANNAGTLCVTPHSIGAGSGIWQVSSSASAVLQISTTSAGAHTGSVNVSNGTLDIDYDFETEGQLTLTNGTIDVASTKTFEAS